MRLTLIDSAYKPAIINRILANDEDATFWGESNILFVTSKLTLDQIMYITFGLVLYYN